jgi:hypothetical protein
MDPSRLGVGPRFDKSCLYMQFKPLGQELWFEWSKKEPSSPIPAAPMSCTQCISKAKGY